MNDYKELIGLLAHPTDGRDSADIMVCAADAIEQLVKERDAAIKDLFEEAASRLNTCLYCKKDASCVLDCDNALWEWRGVTDDN